MFKSIRLTHSGIIDSFISEMKSSSCIIQEKYCILEQRMGAFIPYYAFQSLLPYWWMRSVRIFTDGVCKQRQDQTLVCLIGKIKRLS